MFLLVKMERATLGNIIHVHWSFPEKAMAPHSSTLAWKIPWMEEPGRLQSLGSQRVGHDWVTSLSLFTFMPWRRKWQPTPMFLPGESQRRGSLVDCGLMGSHRVGHDWSDLAAAAATAAISSQFCLGMHRHQLHPWKGVPSVTLMNMHLPREGNGECGIICIWTYPWGNHALGVRQLFFLKP